MAMTPVHACRIASSTPAWNLLAIHSAFLAPRPPPTALTSARVAASAERPAAAALGRRLGPAGPRTGERTFARLQPPSQGSLQRGRTAISTRTFANVAGTGGSAGGGGERKVVLLSGGIESTTVLHMEYEAGTDITPLFVDYAQRGAEMERQACRAVCETLSLELVEMDASGIGGGFRALQGKRRLHVPVPHRNLLILSIALSLASQQQARAIVLALQADDGAWYPSASPSFVESFTHTAATLEPQIAFEAPLRAMRKPDVIRAGAALHVDFARSYSCMLGGELHCGTCRQCLDRRAAFLEADIPDPTLYAA